MSSERELRREQINTNRSKAVDVWNALFTTSNATVKDFDSPKYLLGDYTATTGARAPEIRLFQDGLNPEQFSLRVNLGSTDAAEELAKILKESGLNIIAVR